MKCFFSKHWAVGLETRFIRVEDYTLVFRSLTVVTPLESYVTSIGILCQF